MVVRPIVSIDSCLQVRVYKYDSPECDIISIAAENCDAEVVVYMSVSMGVRVHSVIREDGSYFVVFACASTQSGVHPRNTLEHRAQHETCKTGPLLSAPRSSAPKTTVACLFSTNSAK